MLYHFLTETLNPFLAMVDLMGEGRVDLNVGFTFSLIFRVFYGGRRDCRACPHLAEGRALGDGVVVRPGCNTLIII